MIFISAAAAVFLVSKFKEIDWAFVVLPDEEHEHERYFLSEPQKKIVHAETSQGMVRSVCAFNFLLSRPACTSHDYEILHLLFEFAWLSFC